MKKKSLLILAAALTAFGVTCLTGRSAHAEGSADPSNRSDLVGGIQALADSVPNIFSGDTSLPRVDAVDVASYQSWMTQADFNQLRIQGVRTAIVKLTEGTSYDNPVAPKQINFAANASMNVAAYHYLKLDDAKTQEVANAEAVKEAQKFVNAASYYGLGSSTVMILDCESNGVDRNKVDWTEAAEKFADKLASVGYTNVRYYAGANWIKAKIIDPDVLGYKNIWAAQYLYDKPSATNLKNTQYGAWQFSSRMYFKNMSQSRPLDVSIDYANIFGGGTGPAIFGGPGSVFRLYNPNSGEHFYTESAFEANQDVIAGWKYEGIGWTAPDTGNEVYRLYNPNAGDHFYTMIPFERDSLVKAGWNYEGVDFHSGGNTPLYRAYNPNAKTGAHNYTTSPFEQQNLLKAGWRDEGIAWYGK
ncbi:MAG: family 25 glycosyl hydrolase [Streptococcaceae bacterium]|jgi:GH25 family lysozyme M1 (1,4-beta-N-acetylmuramidase)|nr:family 25 glycosyl hydrolase [Streptococcaceae bacterium]